MAEEFGQLPEYDKRFGNIAIEKGFITPEQLIDALNIQIIGEIKDGKHRLIGQILLKMNHMTLEQIEEVLADLITE
jgi:hypothetical protein